ncbi:transglycosylase domain-containing protein [Clostridiaceae bacterium OttesenSCG-928-D20]|nr:transglycosylase domain-containing protein [Clostridiaceae bacterium OttesenSCG-928-D20]
MDKEAKKKIVKVTKAGTEVVAGGAGVVIRNIFKAIMTVILIFICTGLIFAIIFAAYVKTSLSADLDLTPEDFILSLSSTIYYTDSNGMYQEMTTLQANEERFWVDLESMPGRTETELSYVEKAAVAIEDKRFYKHKGVDWYRTAGAFVYMFLGMENDFGGSTITQQLIKNLTQYDDVTVQRKLLEIFKALHAEKTYTKDQIIEWYLNRVYFGGKAYGVGAASRLYFEKEVWDLSIAESASIIGITNNPSIFSPFVSREKNKERQETILWEMYDQGYINHEEYKAAVAEELVFARAEKEKAPTQIYSYYEEMVIQDVIKHLQERKGYSKGVAEDIAHSGGLSIYACIDPEMQAIVDNYYVNRAGVLDNVASSGDQMLQSAMVIVDPYNGAIRAMTGGAGEKTINYGLNRATGAQRPPGSSIKPIASYGPAMQLGLITQNTMANDSPKIKLAGAPNWYPNNDGGGHSGPVTIRVALARSLNTIAAQIIDKLGTTTSYNFLQEKLGVTSLDERDNAYAPLALGQLTNGITVREMAQAYTAFPNDGIFTYSRSYTHINDSDGNLYMDNPPQTNIAFSTNVARNMVDMLYNATQSGTGVSARISGMPVAGKTGTTTNNWDRYYTGFTPYYVAAVWTGYDINERMYFRTNPAAQIFGAIMGEIHKDLPWKGFSKDFSIGKPTNIFGDVEESPSPDVEDTPEPTPSPSPEVTPSPSPEPPPSPTPPPASTPPVTSPTPPPSSGGITEPPETNPPTMEPLPSPSSIPVGA